MRTHTRLLWYVLKVRVVTDVGSVVDTSGSSFVAAATLGSQERVQGAGEEAGEGAGGEACRRGNMGQEARHGEIEGEQAGEQAEWEAGEQAEAAGEQASEETGGEA